MRLQKENVFISRSFGERPSWFTGVIPNFRFFLQKHLLIIPRLANQVPADTASRGTRRGHSAGIVKALACGILDSTASTVTASNWVSLKSTFTRGFPSCSWGRMATCMQATSLALGFMLLWGCLGYSSRVVFRAARLCLCYAMGRGKAKVQVPECRYGAACTRRDCVFKHPPKPKTVKNAAPEKSDKVCFAFVAGKCAFGRQCHDKHPDEASCQTIKERYAKIDCQWGRNCRTEAGVLPISKSPRVV